jgi:DNA-binding transcriptional regulator YdaS (Cro superfamily)
MTPFEALTAALDKAGSQSALARLCGCSQPAVWKMFQAKRLSVGYVLAVEAATGISRHDLRPDIYPRPKLNRRATDRRDEEALGPWETGDYGNQTDILDFTGGATI